MKRVYEVLAAGMFLAVFLVPAISLAGEIVINEFLASNTTNHPDNRDFDDYSDWLELHNPGSTDLLLDNYYLTDNLDQPFKWKIPRDAVLPANGYLLFRADGFDAGPGETHVRGYYPWGSTFTTERYHTNFKLSAGGESIGLFRNATPPSVRSLIGLGSTWKYHDNGMDPGADWMTLGYGDSNWSEGVGQFGYGEGDESTVVEYGPDAQNKYPTTHFRHVFTVEDPGLMDALRLRVIVDDGAIFYLNGTELARIRMNAGDIDYLDYASATATSQLEGIFETIDVPSELLLAGANVLAVEVHQQSATSSDVSFIAELEGEEITVETIIPLNAVWKFLDKGIFPGNDWMKQGFIDSDWSEGMAELGYGDNDENTVVSYGPDSSDKYPTTYFRHHFTISDHTSLSNIHFRVLVDDGAVIYLNGAEVTRLRMPSGTVGYRDFASALGAEGEFDTIELPASLLEEGDNVLAVEVHQYTADSSDISFNAELVARVVSGTPVLVDSITFGPQTSDISYGRNEASSGGWSYFGEPTPGTANTTEALADLVEAPALNSSIDSGFHAGSQLVALDSEGPVEEIRYTLDGSMPDSASSLYAGPITVTSTCIIRARGFVQGAIPGPVLTRTVFIGEPDESLPVVSMVTEPATFFDDSIGIYENDTPYPFKGREVPVRVEFFDTARELGFSVNAGVRIGGENIWRSAQKPLNITMRGKYGDDAIQYQVFPGESVGVFDKIRFRNGGDNWANAMLRDAMIPSILNGQSEVGLSSYRPCVLYLNGQYWGIYNIRKRLDESYFSSEQYLTEGSYDLVQYTHDSTGAVALMAEIGTVESYREFLEFVDSTDPGDPAGYRTIEARMNVDSFIDSLVAIDFCANTSWRHNREFWSAREDGSKWQWNVTDLDRGFDSGKMGVSLIDDFRSGYPLFKALVNSPEFVDRFIQRYAAHLGSTYYPDRVADILDGLASELDEGIQRHIDRWQADGGIQSLESRQSELDEIKSFVRERPEHALEHLQTGLGLNRGMAELTIVCSPDGSGNVRVAGVPMVSEYNNTLSLFLDTPVELAAEPAPGYVFTGWSNGSTEAIIEVTLNQATEITAHFESGSETLIAPLIDHDTTLTLVGSPFTFEGDLVIDAGSTLTMEAGVQLLVPKGRSIYVLGSLQVHGTSAQPVEIKARGAREWGTLNFVNAGAESELSHLVIRGAGRNDRDPVNLKAAVSAIDSVIILDHVDIEAHLPVFCRYGSTTVRNSTITPLFTGDGINVKSGSGLVENSTFMGNEFPDTDAVDFDNVENGIIRGNRIYAFRGINSDAIDIGEGSVDLLVADNRIFNITDKGVSVGQSSTVHVEGNLIVDCNMGVGVKDTGSTAYIDQNTFARVNTPVAAYEKNVGNGGGIALISNCIFSRSRDEPVYVDSLSTLTVRYSLSDTLLPDGIGNLLGDPRFMDSSSYDFSLMPDSPALDSGDPEHPRDTDGSRADMGAYYTFDNADYPFLVPNVVVVNEVLAHSHGVAPDWIELYNNTSSPLDLSGWFLSDNPDFPEKFRFPEGTVIEAHGYLVLYEDQDFGEGAVNPGSLAPFGLSENGDSVVIYGPGDGLRPDYFEEESFGASMTGVTLGRIYKPSTATYNFVAMELPTPGSENSNPLSGPVVISEIMYHPANPDSEYLELVNISGEPVTLFDYESGTAWKMTDGIQFVFPTVDPVTMEPGERLILTRDASAFNRSFVPPEGTPVFQWISGGLNNGGETVQLSRPGDVDELGERQYIRVDRVKYSDEAPWPVSADGHGEALVKVDEGAYGNDPANWMAASPTPGETGFGAWARTMGLAPGEAAPGDNPDGDRYSNLDEYLFGTDPREANGSLLSFSLLLNEDSVSISLPVRRPDIRYQLQSSSDLGPGGWTNLDSVPEMLPDSTLLIHAASLDQSSQRFYRLLVQLLNQD